MATPVSRHDMSLREHIVPVASRKDGKERIRDKKDDNCMADDARAFCNHLYVCRNGVENDAIALHHTVC